MIPKAKQHNKKTRHSLAEWRVCFYMVTVLPETGITAEAKSVCCL